jgi:hypothetical protein
MSIAIIIDVRTVFPDPEPEQNENGCTRNDLKNHTLKYLLRENTECAICLETYLQGSCMRKIKKCSHSFCVDCIDAWLRNNRTCPNCKCNID